MRSRCRRCDAAGVMNLLFSRLFVHNLGLSTIGGQKSGVDDVTYWRPNLPFIVRARLLSNDRGQC
jgi:hypothetical protein